MEVTSLHVETVVAESGMPHPMPGGEVRGFSQITRLLRQEAVNKAQQLSGHPMPRLLLLATEHYEASLLMNAYSASELLTGSIQWRFRIGDVDASPEVIAPLKNSVFFRPTSDGSGIEPARQSISGILLMAISAQAASVIGPLHPELAVIFNHEILPSVHFLRLRTWPIGPDQRFSVEWVGPEPRPTTYDHVPFSISDTELRQLD